VSGVILKFCQSANAYIYDRKLSILPTCRLWTPTIFQFINFFQDVLGDGDHFSVLAFPCNQFGGQEPENESTIAVKINFKNPLIFIFSRERSLTGYNDCFVVVNIHPLVILKSKSAVLWHILCLAVLWQFLTYKSRISSQELQVKNFKSRIASQELQVKNCKARIASQELQSKELQSKELQVKNWTQKKDESFFSRLYE
jgi:glutathione peroxidase-family protein